MDEATAAGAGHRPGKGRLVEGDEAAAGTVEHDEQQVVRGHPLSVSTPAGRCVTRRVRQCHPALRDAVSTPFWLDRARLTRTRRCGGRDDRGPGGGRRRLHRAVDRAARQGARPGRDVVLLEGRAVGWAATGRNGGFCAASLTHGVANGAGALPGRDRRRWSGSAGGTSTRSRRPSRGTASTATSSAPASSTSPTAAAGSSTGCATTPRPRAARPDGSSCSTRERCGPRCDSPTYLGGVWDRDGVRAWSTRPGWPGACAAACLALGVRIYEDTPATGIDRDGVGVRVAHAARARCAADRWRSAPTRSRRCCGGSGHYIVPVYDYALMTEPLTAAQLAAIGWPNRQGVGDSRQPVPLLPAHRRQPHPVGRLRRRLLLRRQASDPTYDQRPEHVRQARPRTSSRRSRSWTACAFTHTWGGVDRHLQPRSARSSAPRTAAGSPTRPATPGSASARPGSAPR